MDTVGTGEFRDDSPALSQDAILDSAWGQEVGLRVRALRMQRDLTQQELAYMADLSISAISRLERGDRPPTIRIIRRLAAAFQVNLPDLLGLEEQ